MSVSCSDRFTDLLCGEDSDEVFSVDSSELESPASCIEESSIACFIEHERNFVPGCDYLARFQSQSLDASAREEAVAWILKVQAFYNFGPLTAYLSVNYLDRFWYSRRLPQTSVWPCQLLAVACLSLAAKMEEPLVPSLLDLQVEGARYIFEPKTIRRMELLVLTVLDWRLRSVTPFSFIDFFAYKVDPTGTFFGFLISKATDIILPNIKEANFLEYWPSSIAAAGILCAANDIPNLSLVNPEHAELWCNGLSREKILSCYRLMQELIVDNGRRKPQKILPQLRVTIRPRTRSNDSSLSSSSSPSYQRRKLNNCLWVDDDKGNSE
ncbi:Cyclin-D1-1 [Hibiscus syriacus]|uniref:Cyclin-D1-1 n=1 Tax=Hibiscus syriacus TaxID=106335 RepID=A0A6A3A4B8_HIBSY|nr:cyclin-D1-1-like [Hibiscus syriacus]KAE8698893.1 Cyclin-D1-1 [Hibiscus syriacus]